MFQTPDNKTQGLLSRMHRVRNLDAHHPTLLKNLGLDPELLPEDAWESLFFRIMYCPHVQVCVTMLQLIKYLTLHYMMSNGKNSMYVNCILLKVIVKKLTCLHVCCSYGCVLITMLANETILSDHWFAAHESEFLL